MVSRCVAVCALVYERVFARLLMYVRADVCMWTCAGDHSEVGRVPGFVIHKTAYATKGVPVCVCVCGSYCANMRARGARLSCCSFAFLCSLTPCAMGFRDRPWFSRSVLRRFVFVCPFAADFSLKCFVLSILTCVCFGTTSFCSRSPRAAKNPP